MGCENIFQHRELHWLGFFTLICFDEIRALAHMGLSQPVAQLGSQHRQQRIVPMCMCACSFCVSKQPRETRSVRWKRSRKNHANRRDADHFLIRDPHQGLEHFLSSQNLFI